MSTDSERAGSQAGVTAGPKEWADVRQSDVAELLTPGDVARAGMLGRGMVGMTLLMAVALHFAAAMSGGTGTPDPDLVRIMLGVEGLTVFVGAVLFTMVRTGRVPRAASLPPPPAGGLDHAALQPFLGRDVTSRMLRAAIVDFVVLTGAAAHFLFLQQHMPMMAPADLVAMAPVSLAVIYLVFAGTDRDGLAASVAERIREAAEAAELAGR